MYSEHGFPFSGIISNYILILEYAIIMSINAGHVASFVWQPLLYVLFDKEVTTFDIFVVGGLLTADFQ